MAGMKSTPAADIHPRIIDIPYKASRYGTDIIAFAAGIFNV